MCKYFSKVTALVNAHGHSRAKQFGGREQNKLIQMLKKNFF